MTDLDAEKPHVELLPASLEQQPILANLLELYIHDFSEFLPLELRSDGRFGYSNLAAYWRDPETHPDRHPFLVRVDGNLAGFVLIKRGSGISGDASVWDMAEFFIVRGHRRHGIATKIAHDVWSRFPGRWEVRVMESNQPARSLGACHPSIYRPNHSLRLRANQRATLARVFLRIQTGLNLKPRHHSHLQNPGHSVCSGHNQSLRLSLCQVPRQDEQQRNACRSPEEQPNRHR